MIYDWILNTACFTYVGLVYTVYCMYKDVRKKNEQIRLLEEIVKNYEKRVQNLQNRDLSSEKPSSISN